VTRGRIHPTPHGDQLWGVWANALATPAPSRNDEHSPSTGVAVVDGYHLDVILGSAPRFPAVQRECLRWMRERQASGGYPSKIIQSSPGDCWPWGVSIRSRPRPLPRRCHRGAQRPSRREHRHAGLNPAPASGRRRRSGRNDLPGALAGAPAAQPGAHVSSAPTGTTSFCSRHVCASRTRHSNS